MSRYVILNLRSEVPLGVDLSTEGIPKAFTCTVYSVNANEVENCAKGRAVPSNLVTDKLASFREEALPDAN